MATPKKKTSHLKKRHRFSANLKKSVTKILKTYDSVSSQKKVSGGKSKSGGKKTKVIKV